MQYIADTHCHVFPDALAKRASEGIGAFYNRSIAFDGRVDTLLAAGQEAGVTHFVISSVATAPRQVASINQFMQETAAAHPDRICGLGALHPDAADMESDVADLLMRGLRGVKLHPDMQGVPVDDPRFFALFELCQDRIPILCHLGDRRFDCSNPERVKRVLRAFPKLTFIGAHFGGWSIWRDAARELYALDGFITDCSSALFALSPEEACAIVRAYGAERVLFGTDYPMWRADEELTRFHAMGLSRREERLILWENAAALYHLG